MNNKSNAKNNRRKISILLVLAAAIIIVGTVIVKNVTAGEENNASASDIVIPKSEVTETVKFFPVKMGKTNMEVLAVKASDGSIRTAFNTCQVCNGSPRAYYKQQGNLLVCQNCGNKFEMDMIEQQRGGCNPVPIFKENKKDDGNNIVISKDFIEQNKGLFTTNWKTK